MNFLDCLNKYKPDIALLLETKLNLGYKISTI